MRTELAAWVDINLNTVKYGDSRLIDALAGLSRDDKLLVLASTCWDIDATDVLSDLEVLQ